MALALLTYRTSIAWEGLEHSLIKLQFDLFQFCTARLSELVHAFVFPSDTMSTAAFL